MTTITVEELDVEGAPQAGVTIAGLNSGTQVISVQVSWDDGETYNPVSGGTRLTTVGGAFVRDYFCPLNVSGTYRVLEHSIAGDPATDADPIIIGSDQMWLQDPLDPRTAVAIVSVGATDDGQHGMLAGSFAAAAWSQPMQEVTPLGADRPVLATGQRMIAGQVPLIVEHKVAAEGGQLRRLLKQAGQLVLRGHEFDVLEPVAHIGAPDARELRELRFTAQKHQVSTWEMTATQGRPLSARIVIPYFTYAQVNVLWSGSTYANVEAARPGDTYLDWAKNPTP